MIKQSLLNLLGTSVIAIAIIGCGSGGEDTSSNLNNSSGTGFLKDSNLAGITYTCGNTVGTTTDEGKFVYTGECSTIEFSIGDLKLGSINKLDINSDKTVYPADLLGLSRSNTTDSRLVNILRVLQTLDDDNNPNNGINIDSSTTTKLTGITQIDLSNVQTVENDLISIVNTVDDTKSLINSYYAIAHYEDTLKKELNSDVNNVAPAPAIFAQTPNIINTDTTQISINGEVGAQVFIEGIDSGIVIDENNSAILELDTTGEDGEKSFNITLKDNINQESDIFVAKVTKDATAPVFTISSFSILENSTADLISINATDANSISYSIDGLDANNFDINENGILTIKNPADYETKKSYTLNIIAIDSIGNTTSEDITILVTPQNDIAPILTSQNSILYDENDTIPILTLTHTDADIDEIQVFQYSITGEDLDYLNINSETGEVTFKGSPDYEVKKSYSFNAQVTDGINNSETKTITVNINPQNDIAPILNAPAEVVINENSNSDVISLTNSDLDLDQNQTFTYSISGNDSNQFNINSDTGVITFKNSPDYETKKSYSFNAKVTDGVNSSDNKNIIVNINHLNDIAPVLIAQNTISIDENSNTSVITLDSTDADLDETQTFVYSITGTDSNSFNINSTTGEITFKNSPNYETKKSYSFNALVNDGINSSQSQEITITINHLNDETPIITNIEALSIDENSNAALTIISTDADIDESQIFTYTLAGTDANLFNFNVSTGVLTFKDTPDYENPSDSDKDNIYKLTIQVSDGINTSIINELDVNLNNIDDVPTPTAFTGTITGIVSNGEAIANSTVVLQDINQKLLDIKTDATGNYEFVLDNTYEGPFILKAFLPTGEILYSYNDGTKEVTNITPITSLIISKFVVNLNSTMYGLFADFNTLYANNSEFNTLFNNAYNEVSEYFNLFLASNLLTNFNHIYNSFYSLGFDYDKILDTLDMAITSDVVIIRHNNNVYSTIPNITLENIDVTGRILDATGSALEGAEIIASYASSQVNTITDSDGRYILSLPNYENIDLRVLNNDEIINYYGLSTFFSSSDNSQQVDTIQYTQESTTPSTISGYIYNGRTSGTKIPNVTINIREGYNNRTGDISNNLISDSIGDYTIDLNNGNYTFEFSKDDWSTEYYNVLVNEDSNNYNYFINDFDANYITSNALMTAVLTWGNRPSDLDTHLTGPKESTTSRFHVYYSDKTEGTNPSNSLSPCQTEGTIATLDVDDTSAYGPETLSLCERIEGTYHYYIYNYSGSPQFNESNANVRVKTANGFSYTFNVPYDSSSTARYWHVFDMDEYGNIIPINTLKSTSSGL